MGTDADNLDRLRDSGKDCGVNTGWSQIRPIDDREYFRRKDEIHNKLQSLATYYHNAVTGKDNIKVLRTRKEIETIITELENDRYYSCLAEKELLRLINKKILQSPVIKDIVSGLQLAYKNSYESAEQIKIDVLEKVNINFNPTPKDIDSDVLRNNIVKSVFGIVDNGIVSGLPLSREAFKSLVKDLGHILQMLKYNDKKKVSKFEVEQYFMDEFQRKRGAIVCQNCHRSLLEGIPYCFDCFDGRYS